jgi:NAD(P)-dependent dehydrogenase (short-subunit alcohol dehydrogenase family)
MTDIKERVALVTGANRGLGKAFVDGLLERGAAKVYATARDPQTVDTTDPRVVPLPLDVTDAASVAAVTGDVPDLNLLINNAGVYVGTSPLTGDLDRIRAELETNYFGPLRVARALAPVIAGNGGGALLNVHSILSWVAFGGSYSASKAALWSATNTMRLELAPQGVQVVGLHVGYIDTDMAARVTEPKIAATEVVAQALDGIESGAWEVLADDGTRRVRAALGADLTALYPQLAGTAS